MKRILFLFPVLAFSLLFSACKKNNDGKGGVKYQFRTTSRTSNVSARIAGTITWSSGFANATKIKFEAEANDKEVEFTSLTNQHIDLFAPLTTIGQIAIPPGSYEEVEFHVMLAPVNGEPALELRGTYNGIPVVFRITEPFEFEGEKEGVTIDINNGYTLLTSVDLSNLTKGITDAALTNAVQTNGEIVISPDVNPSLYGIILNNLHESDQCDFDHDDSDNDD